MSTTTLAGLLLIVVPLAFNGAFAALASRFDYPDVLRQPDVRGAREVPCRRERRWSCSWWGFALTAVAMVPLVVLLSSALADADATLLSLATWVGVLAALVQFLGPDPVAVPGPVPGAGRRPTSEVVDVVFQAFNRYLGVAVGEHLGYLFTGAWTTLAGVALVQSAAVPGWLGVVGIVIGPVLAAVLARVRRARAGSSPSGSRRSPTSRGRCGSSRTGVALVAS